MLLSHTNTITMGDIRAPSMDWSHPDRASTYKLQRGPGRGGRSHGSDTRYDSRSVDAVQQAQYDDDDDDDSFAQVAYH